MGVSAAAGESAAAPNGGWDAGPSDVSAAFLKALEVFAIMPQQGSGRRRHLCGRAGRAPAPTAVFGVVRAANPDKRCRPIPATPAGGTPAAWAARSSPPAALQGPVLSQLSWWSWRCSENHEKLQADTRRCHTIASALAPLCALLACHGAPPPWPFSSATSSQASGGVGAIDSMRIRLQVNLQVWRRRQRALTGGEPQPRAAGLHLASAAAPACRATPLPHLDFQVLGQPVLNE